MKRMDFFTRKAVVVKPLKRQQPRSVGQGAAPHPYGVYGKGMQRGMAKRGKQAIREADARKKDTV